MTIRHAAVIYHMYRRSLRMLDNATALQRPAMERQYMFWAERWIITPNALAAKVV